VQAITNLLQSFGVDSAIIANVQAVLENQATTTPSIAPFDQSQSGNNCNILDNNLQFGATDDSTNGDVSQLQAFLGKDKSVYPEGRVTGYYGSLTLEAVKRWQEAHGIVSSGDPESTGFGHIGPRTRREMDKEMEMECEQEDSQNSSPENSGEHSNSSATSTSHGFGSGDN
jgi:peptidoglycan hydrolase-like protein with peptidoglycan-binding domain